jgi:hypothetical protein
MAAEFNNFLDSLLPETQALPATQRPVQVLENFLDNVAPIPKETPASKTVAAQKAKPKMETKKVSLYCTVNFIV